MSPHPTRTIGSRLAWAWPWKLLLGPAATLLFFAWYGFIQRHPLGPVVVVPWTWIDGWLPFVPLAVHPYLSLVLFMPLLPWLLDEREALIRYFARLTLLGCAGLVCFAWVPTAIERPPLPESPGPLLVWLREWDGVGNACPSLHAGYTVFTGLGLWQVTGSMAHASLLRSMVLAWSALILLAILLVKQHTLTDVLVGAGLGAVATRIPIPLRSR